MVLILSKMNVNYIFSVIQAIMKSHIDNKIGNQKYSE